MTWQRHDVDALRNWVAASRREAQRIALGCGAAAVRTVMRYVRFGARRADVHGASERAHYPRQRSRQARDAK